MSRLLPSWSGAEMVGGIYEAALDAKRWPDFLAHLSVALNSETGLIWANDFEDQTAHLGGLPGVISANVGFAPEFLDSFVQYYSQRNVWLERPELHREGTVVTSATLYPESRLEKTEWYGDWLRPQGLYYTAAVIVEKRRSRTFNVTVTRRKSAGSYDAAELALLGRLMPHLQSAFALHRRLHRLEVLSHASVQAIESLTMGLALMGDDGQVIHANAEAHSLINKVKLLRLDADGGLSAVAAKDDQRLQKALREAVSTGGGQTGGSGAALRLRGLDDQQLHLLIAPLPRRASPFGELASAAVFITDPSSVTRVNMFALIELYGLTAAEARMTQAITNGLTPQEYAVRQGLSLNTVRTQFRSAATKVGVGRQADFVRAVLMGPAVLSPCLGSPAILGL